MEEPRIIKKYPNRRLYDTEVSRYITLDEVKELVIQRTAFKIIDDRTNEDMTNYVLIQILAQEENGASPLFTAEILKGLICFYGNPLQKAMSQYLEKGLSLFSNPELNFGNYLQHVIEKDDSINKIAIDARKSIDLWGDMLTKYLANTTAENAGENRENPSPK